LCWLSSVRHQLDRDREFQRFLIVPLGQAGKQDHRDQNMKAAGQCGAEA
jgi:hypothetical protein